MSTATTRAPSRAKRIAVARPLPTVSPGVCPAPMTTAIFPSSRLPMVYALLAYRSIAALAPSGSVTRCGVYQGR